MAFFGLPDNELPRVGPDEDLAVYTWGEDSYDGLGDALQEGGDDLNDETFGSVGTVGQYSSSTLFSTFPYHYQARILTLRVFQRTTNLRIDFRR